MHACVSVYICVYAERDRISITLVTTAAQGCANDLLKRQANTSKQMVKINTSTQAQYLSTQPRETRTLTGAMKAWQKCPLAGPTTGCRTNQAACIEEKQRVRQPTVRYTQQNKPQKTIAHQHKHTHRGTHVICDMFWKASGCTDVIPFDERSSVPACVGQEPVRTSGALA